MGALKWMWNATKIVGGVACPPVGIAFDALDLAVDIGTGNWVGAGITATFMVAKLIPGGALATSGLKSSAKLFAGVATEASKSMNKEVGKHLAKEIAKSGLKKAAAETAKATIAKASKSISKDIGKRISIKIAKEGLRGAAKKKMLASGKVVISLFVKNAGKGVSKSVATQAMIDVAKKQVAGKVFFGALKTVVKKTAVEDMGKQAITFVATVLKHSK